MHGRHRPIVDTRLPSSRPASLPGRDTRSTPAATEEMSVILYNRDEVAVTLVEDEVPIARLFGTALETWNYRYQTARTAAEGFDLLAKKPTPILIADLDTLHQAGLAVLQEIRDRWPDITVMVLTQEQDVTGVLGCLNLGADRLFFKPVRLDELRQAVESSLASHHQKRERQRYQKRLEQTVQKQSSRLRSRFAAAIESLLVTLEIRDPATYKHSQRVRKYAAYLARAMGLDKRHQREVALAAQLHDIGKITIPEAILHKPADLTPDEIAAVQAHPVTGENILRPLIRNARVLAAIRNHHERMDGRGYPDGLTGNSIPLEARMVSIVDCFDALTELRPYRRHTITPVEALAMLEERAHENGHLDPHLVRTFADLVRRQPELTLRISGLSPSGFSIAPLSNR